MQALGAEAKLLAAPVSLEMGSSTQAEGIEDRISLLPLGGRRLAEQVDRGTRVLALGLVGACQAIDLRGDATPLGPPLRAAHAAVRAHVPALGPGASLPETLEPLVEDVARGALAGLARALAGPPISDG